MLNAARRCRGIAILAMMGISISTAPPPAHAASNFEHFVFGMSIADNMFGGPTGPNYGELRQQFFAKIDAARQAVDQCGGCSGAQAQLNALLAEEDQFQRIAGRIMGMTGQPPAMARLLGIRTDTWEYKFPFASTSSYGKGEGLYNTNPQWLREAPDYCRQPVLSHLQALRHYQDSEQSIFTDHLTDPGGEFYEAHRFYQACRLKDYEEFDRLLLLRDARAAGEILPELEPTGRGQFRERGLVYFGDVPDDFLPPMPPAATVEAKLAEKDVREVRFLSNKKTNGYLIETAVTPLVPSIHLRPGDFDSCINVRGKDRKEGLKRTCEDQSEIGRFNPYVLLCGYRATTPTNRLARTYAIYWYNKRVPLAEYDYLLKRHQQHPLLAIGEARTDCPATKAASAETDRDYQSSLVALRQQHPQTPFTSALPESAWLRERREAHEKQYQIHTERQRLTEEYSWPGYYAFDYAQRAESVGRTRAGRGVAGGAAASGDCVVAEDPLIASRYRAACWSQDRVSVGSGRKAHGYALDLDLLPPNQLLLEPGVADTLSSDMGGGEVSLVRKGDLFAFGEFPLLGDYLLMLGHGDDALRAFCSFSLSSSAAFYDLHCVDDRGRHLEALTRVRTGSYDGARMLETGGLIVKPTWEDKYNGRQQRLMIDGVGLNGLFFIIDPRFVGDDLGNARLLAFAINGISGSMQRIGISATGSGVDDEKRNLTGRWVGEYQCDPRGKREAELHLDDSGVGGFRSINGTFVFRDPLFGQEGSYRVSGEYLSGIGSFRLRPGEWIESPQYGYNTAELLGAAILPPERAGDGVAARIAGDFMDRTCGALKLTQVSRTLPDIVQHPDAEPNAAPDERPPTTTIAQPNSTIVDTKPVITMTSEAVRTGHPLVVTVSGLPGNPQDWVTLIQASRPDAEFGLWEYTKGVQQGTWKFTAGNPGDYEVRVYYDYPDGGYKVQARASLKVVR